MKTIGARRGRLLLGLGLAVMIARTLSRRRSRAGRVTDHPGTAVITGASSGIGAEFARQLAVRGYNLFLVARRAERLAALAAELEQRHPIAAQILVADLANPSEVEWIERRLAGVDDLSLLVNNAGFRTGSSRFAESNLGKHIEMIQVHDLATMRLTRAALPRMLARHGGAVINVSSLAAIIPVGGNSVYAASKAFLNAFSEALHVELLGTGVRIQALCPGFTHTEFHDRPDYHDARAKSRIPGPIWSTAPQVVAESLAALDRDEVIVIPGWHYRLAALIARSGLATPVVRLIARRWRPHA